MASRGYVINYARRIYARRMRGRAFAGPCAFPTVAPVPAAPSAATPLRQLAGDGIPIRVNGRHRSLNGRRIRPFVWIETMEMVGQPVPLFRRSGPPGDPLEIGRAHV